MNEPAKKKRTPAPRSRKAERKAAREKQLDSEAVARAVYDGMQDLRTKKRPQ